MDHQPENKWLGSVEKLKRIFLIEAFLFSITLVLGIATAFRINEIFISNKLKIPEVSTGKFIVNFLIATFVIFFILHLIKARKKKGIILKLLFIFSVFVGSTLMFNAWFSDLLSLFLGLSLIVVWWKYPFVLIQDLCIVLGIAGVGSFLGLTLRPNTVIFFLIIFSIYDLIAVYKTKHMVEMAKEMIKSGVVLGLVIPSNLLDFREELKEVKPGGRFLVLGGGDITFPLFLCASMVPFGVLKSLIIAFFALFGLLVSFLLFISQKKRKAIPALPPIALFSIIGFLITRFV